MHWCGDVCGHEDRNVDVWGHVWVPVFGLSVCKVPFKISGSLIQTQNGMCGNGAVVLNVWLHMCVGCSIQETHVCAQEHEGRYVTLGG